ncbi:MAG: SUMF1/EgtB/PvdO family nonheme iron enzyme [Victivallales bacterium]|nr:SUMF1/EgtB/PvdO family nonheme iron enzyme [Victivallales bacterium]
MDGEEDIPTSISDTLMLVFARGRRWQRYLDEGRFRNGTELAHAIGCEPRKVAWRCLLAWYKDNSDGKTHEVKTKMPNELGIYDMSGNVWEWCLDDYIDDSSKMKPEFIRENDKSAVQRVDRGGAWDYNARVALRSKFAPDGRRLSIGFRVVLVPNQY